MLQPLLDLLFLFFTSFQVSDKDKTGADGVQTCTA